MRAGNGAASILTHKPADSKSADRIHNALLDLSDFDDSYIAKLRERFDAKWTPEPNTGCRLWTAALSSEGYGSIGIGSRGGQPIVRAAHRVGFLLEYGSIGADLVLDHTCRNRACVAPHHLEPVSHQTNVARGLCGELKTLCRNGHPFVRGKRCPECATADQLKWRTGVAERLGIPVSKVSSAIRRGLHRQLSADQLERMAHAELKLVLKAASRAHRLLASKAVTP